MIVPYTPNPEEPAEITAMRQTMATEVRRWCETYAEDLDVTDIDFAHSLHRFTYEQAMKLARRSIEIYNEGRAPGDRIG